MHNDPDDFYRYPDLTIPCEATCEWLEQALEQDVVAEIAVIRAVRAAMREIVEMPDKLEQLFIKLCIDNRGRLSKAKHDRFAMLDDETLGKLEAIVRSAMRRGLR